MVMSAIDADVQPVMLNNDAEVSMELDTVCILDRNSILNALAFVYTCCEIKDTTMLLNYIVSMCKKCSSQSSLCMVNSDPLPLQGGPPYPGFLLTFDSAIEAVTTHSFLPLHVKNHIWIYVFKQLAAEIAIASVAIGNF